MCDFSFIQDTTLREACIVTYVIISQLTKHRLEYLQAQKRIYEDQLSDLDKQPNFDGKSILHNEWNTELKNIKYEMKEPIGWEVFDFDIPTNPYTRIDPATANCYFKKWDVSIGLKRILECKQICTIYENHGENFIYQVLLIMRQLRQTNKKP